jgi:hypothetical protein
MRAMCSITRAPILIRRFRIVANSALASGLVRGIATRTPCISPTNTAELHLFVFTHEHYNLQLGSRG